MFLFNSRDTQYKQPFGALAEDEKASITFPVSLDLKVQAVYMIIRGEWETRCLTLCHTQNSSGMAIYKTSFSLGAKGIYYYRFEVVTDGGTLFVGTKEDGGAVQGEWLPEWQQTVYAKGYTTQESLQGGLIYHIFADRFARAENTKKPRFGYLKDWNEDVEVVDSDGVFRANDFFGGNIGGILQKLDYLKLLNVTCIYLSPIFEARSNHRYDTGDYMKVDELFGSEEEFATLTAECEKRGMTVMLDGVFNHTGADSLYFNKFGSYPSLGAYQSKNSPFYNWYTFTDFPDKYDCWWGVTVVPSIKKDSLDFQDMIAGDGGVLEKWTRLGVKGWRLDVADELLPSFLQRIRKVVKDKGDAAIIGEVWEDASTKESYSIKREYLLGEELDGVTNYLYRTAIIRYLQDKDAKRFKNTVLSVAENYPKQSLDTSMTLVGTHDTIRIINELSGAIPHGDKKERLKYRLNNRQYERGKRKLKLAAALQYILPGVPCVYYGDEVGLQGFDDPINRRPMPWGKEDMEILEWYRALGKIRAENREDILGDIRVETLGSVIKIKRGRLVLVVNPASADFVLEQPVFDLLSQKQTALVEGGFAVIYKK